jgi:hypothetical protein
MKALKGKGSDPHEARKPGGGGGLGAIATSAGWTWPQAAVNKSSEIAITALQQRIGGGSVETSVGTLPQTGVHNKGPPPGARMRSEPEANVQHLPWRSFLLPKHHARS